MDSDTAQPNYSQTFFSFVTGNKTWTFPVFILLLVVMGAFLIREVALKPTRSVTVVGMGKKSVAPEKATMSFSLAISGRTQEDAIRAGEERFNAILDSISSYTPEIQRTAYQIISSSASSTTTARTSSLLGGYQYVNAARITIADPLKAQQLARDLYAQGVTVVTPVRYVPGDEKKVNGEVREMAIADAKERARQMARASGLRVGKVINMQEGDLSGQTNTSIGASVGSNPTESSGLNVDSEGNVEYQTSVSVSFELK